MKELTVTLPIDTINVALTALGKLPYEVVRNHIDLIEQRSREAFQKQQAEAEPAESQAS